MPRPPDVLPAQLDSRTNPAILIGMLVPVTALAMMAWLSTPPVPPSNSAVSGAASASGVQGKAGPARRMKVQVLASYPHDPSAFTQGLHYEGNGVFYESTGLEGQSMLKRVDLATGRALKAFALAPDLFGEGLARTPRALLQLTYKNQVALVYDPASLTVIGQFAYAGEGWGVCFDGTSLVMSNGSDTLTFRGRMNFVVQRSLRVVRDGSPLAALNELECVNDSIYANVWGTDVIARIDPASGTVTESIDAAGLLSEAEAKAKGVDVLNGIAYDRTEDVFYITGKRWPKLFKVRFVPAGT
ncbi:MAG: glutaminyl-peptide cyclotransferase [Vicinamibacteraceae bacterium]